MRIDERQANSQITLVVSQIERTVDSKLVALILVSSWCPQQYLNGDPNCVLQVLWGNWEVLEFSNCNAKATDIYGKNAVFGLSKPS